MKPLEGIKVLDMTRILAGPWASQLLGDLGAEVVKIERPGTGDDTRGWGPPYLRDADGTETGEAAYFLCTNRGKQSFAVDFTSQEGGDLVRRLALEADVMLENYKFGGLAKYGLDYDSLAKDNPGLVYCSITGFGQTGPNREKPGYDAMIQAISGLMSVNGVADGEPGAAPLKVGVAVSDLFAGFYAANGIQAALIQRGRTGKGQHIDIALYDCQVASLANQATNYLVSGTAPGRMGSAHPNLVPYEVFTTRDGHLMVAIGNDAQFVRLIKRLELNDIANDQRFETNRGRVENRTDIIPALNGAFAKQPTIYWIDALAEVGIPCGPVRTLDEVFASEQARARGLRIDMPHETAGTVPQVRCPIRMSGSDVGAEIAPPLLGQHTDDVLGTLGLGADEITALEEKNIVQR